MLAMAGSAPRFAFALDSPLPPVALFSKVCQEIHLSFDATSEVVAEAGLDGIDCPVRPEGQVLPEHVGDELPKFSEALRQRGRRVLLLTTAIRGLSTPHAETILRTARQVGVKFYRLGYWTYREGIAKEKQLGEIKAQLQDLAALNRELGLCGLLQNHAGSNLVGAKVRDLYDISRTFPPEQIALAFDIGHALNELPDTWQIEFDHLKSHLGVVYVKDWVRGAGFVPFGSGEIGASGFFRRVKSADLRNPLSVHTEYEWNHGGERKTRAALVAALRRDLKVLQGWWAEL